MTVSRRRLLHSLALAAPVVPSVAAEPALTLEAIRSVAAAQGANLTDERLRVLMPILDRRSRQLQALRDLEIDDNIAPTQGILEE